MARRRTESRRLAPQVILGLGTALFVAIGGVVATWYILNIWRETPAVQRFGNEAGSCLSDFTAITGLQCPGDTTVNYFVDTHGGLQGDGLLCLIVTVGIDTINRWSSNSAPWGGKWTQGPVPVNIGVNCSTNDRRIWLTTASGGAQEYRGFQPTIDVLQSGAVLYVAKPRGPETMNWHNGNLLIIDRESGQAWLFLWDM